MIDKKTRDQIIEASLSGNYRVNFCQELAQHVKELAEDRDRLYEALEKIVMYIDKNATEQIIADVTSALMLSWIAQGHEPKKEE